MYIHSTVQRSGILANFGEIPDRLLDIIVSADYTDIIGLPVSLYPSLIYVCIPKLRQALAPVWLGEAL